MNRYIAFLRGMNLGNRRIKMDALRGHFEAMKFARVETFIASGNVIFHSKEHDGQKLARHLEEQLAKRLGYEVDTFVRTPAEVAAVAAFQPFSPADMKRPEHTMYVGFLNAPLSDDQARGLVACRTEVDELHVEGREYYWLCRIKSNESKVWTSPQLRALKLPSSSMRNLTTIRKLAALYSASPA